MSKATEAESIHALTTIRLASMAECAGPDSPTSAGAAFLESVRDSVVEEVEANGIEDWEARDSFIHEAADSAPDTYTHRRWQEFVDLAAYQEDISEFGDYSDDLTKAAGVALYMIAERLIRALFGYAADQA